jgi:hypothetical protein
MKWETIGEKFSPWPRRPVKACQCDEISHRGRAAASPGGLEKVSHLYIGVAGSWRRSAVEARIIRHRRQGDHATTLVGALLAFAIKAGGAYERELALSR